MDLDFKNTNTSYSTHGFHTYPAKMIPQIASKMITEFGKGAEILFDPFCGSGTSLVEANIKGIKAFGSDLNPLARLIALVKTTPIEMQTLDLHFRDFYDYLFSFRFKITDKKHSIISPSFHNIDFWFSKSVKNDLSVISHFIDQIENINVKNFFKVALSQTIRECSWTRKNEFKLYKMSPERIKVFKPDAISTFEKILGKNRNGLLEFMSQKVDHIESKILDFNTINKIPNRIIPKASIDIVLTSPPYGDSSTTVAYGQFSALANQWLGFMEKGRSLDNELMGGKRALKLKTFNSSALNDNILDISRIDKNRALDVISFYKDYHESIRNISSVVKEKGIACYVVSNRTVKGTTLCTDQITKDFFKEFGFSHLETFSRKISNKRMPRENSSTGKTGEKTKLMNTEYVVVMQKK